MPQPSYPKPYRWLAQYYDTIFWPMRGPLNTARKHILRRTVATSVARALRPGGYFYFDVNNAPGFERYWTGNVWFEKPGVVLVMRNGHVPHGHRAWSDIEWFVREGSSWRRHHEHVQEVCWESSEIQRTLRAAGFDPVRAWDAAPLFKDDPIIGPGCRTIYLARKLR